MNKKANYVTEFSLSIYQEIIDSRHSLLTISHETLPWTKEVVALPLKVHRQEKSTF